MSATVDAVASPTILAVDDNAANLSLLRAILRREGCEDVHTVADARQVMPTFEEVHPDIVLLDLNMPHVNGFEIMARLSQVVPEGTFLPIVVLTADISPEARRRALSAGASDFLLKPLDPVEVVLRVRNLLHTRRLHQRVRWEKDQLELRVGERTAELRAANEALVVSDRIKTDFISMASHEMRTPLTVIKGFIEVLLQRWREIDGERVDDQLRTMQRNVVRLERLVSNLLLASRVEQGQDGEARALGVRATDFEVAEFLHRAVRDGAFTGTSVILHCPEGQHVTADKSLLEHIVVNLLTNAQKYGDPPVELHCRVSPGTIDLVVRDHGPGVPEEFVPHLFDRFTQASVGDRRTASGAGLGLWIASGLAQLHGGDLTYQPASPRGASFRVRVQQITAGAPGRSLRRPLVATSP